MMKLQPPIPNHSLQNQIILKPMLPKLIFPKRIISTPLKQIKQIMLSYVRQLRIKFNRNQIKNNHLKIKL